MIKLTNEQKEIFSQWVRENVGTDIVPPDEGNEEELIDNLIELIVKGE
jgi:hypothetical protein